MSNKMRQVHRATRQGWLESVMRGTSEHANTETQAKRDARLEDERREEYEEDHPCRPLTRHERLQELADRGCDTWEEYRGER